MIKTVGAAFDQKSKTADFYSILADEAKRSAGIHGVNICDYEAERLGIYVGQFWWKREQAHRFEQKRQLKAAKSKRSGAGKKPKGSSWGWKKHIADQGAVRDAADRWAHFKSI